MIDCPRRDPLEIEGRADLATASAPTPATSRKAGRTRAPGIDARHRRVSHALARGQSTPAKTPAPQARPAESTCRRAAASPDARGPRRAAAWSTCMRPRRHASNADSRKHRAFPCLVPIGLKSSAKGFPAPPPPRGHATKAQAPNGEAMQKDKRPAGPGAQSSSIWSAAHYTRRSRHLFEATHDDLA